jgi:hypothetical protein
MTNTHTTTNWRATPVARTDNVELVRQHTTYKKSKDGKVLWQSGERVDSKPLTIPVAELHLVIAELSSALFYEYDDLRHPPVV